jgi:hypothetical protein
MKDSTKRFLAIVISGLMSAYFLFSGIFVGTPLLLIPMGIGMGATFIALIVKSTHGKIYNTAVLLGGLSSLVFLGFAIWAIITGEFKPASLIALVVGVIGLLLVSKVVSAGEEIENGIEEVSTEANE